MATLPIFLVWLCIAWSIILFGAELTASIQRGDIPPMLGPMSPDFLYSATMHILIRLADRAYRGGDDITCVEFDQGARDGDPRVDLVLAKMGAVRNGLLKTITLEDIRSPEAKAVDEETAAIKQKANQ